MPEFPMGKHSHSVSFLVFLTVTSLLCGAIVMVIEVLGSRVLGPFFGASLFVWTSLITVTLVGLALGYVAGGILSDRRESPDYLYGIILAAGILVEFIPFLRGEVLKLCVPFGLRLGALASSTLLFGPSLFLLGAVSPYIIKIAAREMRTIGKTVGLFYAVSTLGSFAGTICTGFVLIAYFGISQIFTFIGGTLLLLAVVYFIVFKRHVAVLAFLIIPFIFSGPKPVESKLLPNGTRVERIFSKDSFYGSIRVLDYSFGDSRTRELIVDGAIQGGIDVKNGLSVYEYYYFLQFIPYLMNPEGKNCLVIGLGPGVIPMWYEKMGVRTDVVDIDPEIFAVARKYFNFTVSGDSIVCDARYYLNSSTKKYDYVILDVFNGDNAPVHILSKEMLEVIHAKLAPNGVLGINLHGSLKKEPFMTASVIDTLKKVFKIVEIYPTFRPEEDEGVGNLAVIACNGKPRRADTARANKFPVHPMAASVYDMINRKFEFPGGTNSMVLTDNYNPIDVHDLWLKEFIRKKIIADTDMDVLL